MGDGSVSANGDMQQAVFGIINEEEQREIRLLLDA